LEIHATASAGCIQLRLQQVSCVDKDLTLWLWLKTFADCTVQADNICAWAAVIHRLTTILSALVCTTAWFDEVELQSGLGNANPQCCKSSVTLDMLNYQVLFSVKHSTSCLCIRLLGNFTPGLFMMMMMMMMMMMRNGGGHVCLI
jgi:hypothetical protein